MKAPLNSATVVLPAEKALLLQTAGGDEQAFRAIFDAYRPRIYSFALHLTENASTADEIVQETFLRVWLHRQKLPAVLHFNAWLYSIARNQVFDAMKAAAKERTMVASMPGHGAANNIDETIADKEYAQLLQEAVSRLPGRQQQIFQLSRDTGIQHAEIAGRLNISRHTVKTHLVHALRNIRKYLQYHSGEVMIWVLMLTLYGTL